MRSRVKTKKVEQKLNKVKWREVAVTQPSLTS